MLAATADTSCQSATAGPAAQPEFQNRDATVTQLLSHCLTDCLEVTNQTEPTCMANPCCGLVLRSGKFSAQHVCNTSPAAIAQLHNCFGVLYRFGDAPRLG